MELPATSSSTSEYVRARYWITVHDICTGWNHPERHPGVEGGQTQLLWVSILVSHQRADSMGVYVERPVELDRDWGKLQLFHCIPLEAARHCSRKVNIRVALGDTIGNEGMGGCLSVFTEARNNGSVGASSISVSKLLLIAAATVSRETECAKHFIRDQVSEGPEVMC